MPPGIETTAPTQSDIFSAFGLDTAGKKPAADPPAAPPGNGGAPTDPPAQPPNDPPPTDPPKDETDPDGNKDPNKQPPPDDKANRQFAAMRVQLRQYETLMSDLAKLLNIPDTADANARMDALKDAILKGQSKASGISEDILRKQQATDQELATFRAEQHAGKMYGQFQKVMDTFKLDQSGLKSFAEELAADGVDVFDPSNGHLDLVREYRDRHFEEILAARTKAAADAAVEAERKRAEKAGSQSSTPSGRQGAPAGDPNQKIDTQAQLSGFLDGLNVK